MWWTRRSEKRFTVWLESAALGLVEEPLAIILPVVNEGVWQWAQPTFVKVARPFTVEGVSGAGVGGANMRMKLAKASMSEMTAGLEVAALGGRRRKVERVIWRGGEETCWSLVALLREQLVRDSHLHVVRLAREHEQGFVLRLPSEARNGSVVCTAIRIAAQVRVGVTGNAQLCLLGCVGLDIGENRRVGNRLYESGPKDRRGDAKDDVWISARAGERISSRQKVGLGDIAARGVAPTGDDEEIVHLAVVSSVRIPLKACFPHRAFRRDEPGHHVLCPIERRYRDHGVLRRARSAGSGLRVAGEALVGVEAGPEPIVRASLYNLDFYESC